jgi:hypothetical protein
MVDPRQGPFEVHLAVASEFHDGKHCREYRAFDGAARPLFRARARRAPGTIHVFAPDPPGTATLVMEPRWTFPFTGKYEIRRADDGRLLGVARRNGKLSDAAGRRLARFADARSLRSFLGEGVVEMAVNAALGADGDVHGGPGSDTFMLLVDGRPAGSLRRGRLPFLVEPPVPERQPAAWQAWIRRVLPRSWLEARPPSGWRLTLDPPAASLDRDLVVAQALLTAEISAW